jgi:DNA-binding MarR family transcriptional regulator
MASHDAERHDHDCSPRDSVDALLESWAQRRPDLDFAPVAVISRLARIRGHIDAELESVFRAFGLSPSDFAALVTLARVGEPQGATQHTLAVELGLTPGTVSLRIDRLVKQGLAERRSDPASRRSTLVTLTAAGRELFERVTPAHLANERRLLAALPADELELLAGLLRKLLVEFEGSQPAHENVDRLGLTLAPAHATIGMRTAVGLPQAAGLLVRTVEPDSPAALGNLQPGDVLIQAGQRELRSSASLYAAIREAGPNPLRMTVLRGNDQILASLPVRPHHNDTPAAVTCGPQGRAEHRL